MDQIFNLENKDFFVAEINKQGDLPIKSYLVTKVNRKVNLLDSYEKYYNVSSDSKLSKKFSYLNEATLKNRRYAGLSIKVSSEFPNFYEKNKDHANTLIIPMFKKSHGLRVLGNSKNLISACFKGVLGALPKSEILSHIKDELSYKNLLLKGDEIPLTVNYRNVILNVSFPAIKHNFCKTRKRRQLFTELNVSFTIKKYEKSRKSFKAKNSN